MLYKTLHGSHLYGLAHKDSDVDYYTVLNTKRTARSKYSKQTIVDGIDSTVVDFGTWMHYCQNGVPQALEAMFASAEYVQFEAAGMKEFRSAFRFGSAARDRYYRTIDNFLATRDFKKNRHALRLALNLRDGLQYGRFNPTLSKKQAIWVTYLAKNMPWEEYRPWVLDYANK